MIDCKVGDDVKLIPSCKRYHGGAAKIVQIDETPKCSKPYLLERKKKPEGTGKLRFWAARGEFETKEQDR